MHGEGPPVLSFHQSCTSTCAALLLAFPSTHTLAPPHIWTHDWRSNPLAEGASKVVQRALCYLSRLYRMNHAAASSGLLATSLYDPLLPSGHNPGTRQRSTVSGSFPHAALPALGMLLYLPLLQPHARPCPCTGTLSMCCTKGVSARSGIASPLFLTLLHSWSMLLLSIARNRLL